MSVAVTGALATRAPEPALATATPSRAPLAALVGARAGATRVRPSTIHPADGASSTAPPVSRRRLGHWHRTFRLAGDYGVGTDLARSIHDIALAEGIDPELAFRLVRAESEFNERATSRVGAVGLTQLMPETARYFVRGRVSRERLYDPRLNLHVGFRYLRALIHQYRSLRTALLVYNRGPVAVEAAMKRGDDPANGYENLVARGYRGSGTVGFAPRRPRAVDGDVLVRRAAASRLSSPSR